MTKRWIVALIVAVILLMAFSIALAWSAPQNQSEPPKLVLHGDQKVALSTKDHELIEGFYRRLMGTLAPGSITRSPFSAGEEKTLITGSHVPMQLERDLEPLPKELESQLTQLTGDYRRYKLGPHVLLVKVADLTIADVIKNVGLSK